MVVLLWYLPMKITYGSIIKLTIRYAYRRGNTYYYQRKIPLDLMQRYGGAKHVKVNLKTTNLKQIAKKITALNKKYESTWSSLRANPKIEPLQVREAATKLLAKRGLRPLPASNNEIDVDLFIESFHDRRAKYARGDEEIYWNALPEEYLDPVEVEAVQLIFQAPKFFLSDALNVYLNNHLKKDDEKFCSYVQRVWNKLIEIIGDKEFEKTSRVDANEFVSKRLDEGPKTTTVDRQISTISAVFNVVITEKELTKANPFLKLRIPGLGKDSKQRGTFNSSQLSSLIHACKKNDDDVRWLLALQIDLGCRLAETTGLAIEDLHLEVDIPYVSFKPHPWRPLKTKLSKRNIPLVGISLWAAHRIIDSAKKEQVYAFPRYTDGNTCNANYASASLNKWIRSLGIDKTTHELRHTMRDRLRQANAPKSIQDAVGGWGKEDIGDNYGLGFGLKQLKDWLDKIVLK